MAPVVLLFLTGTFAIGSVAAVILWPQILSWGEESLIPWLSERSPSLAELARKAFVPLDRLAVAAYRVVKSAWTQLRSILLKQVVHLQRETSDVWLKTVTSWVIEVLGNGQKQPVKIVTQERVSYYDLPEDVRAASLRWGQKDKTTDLTDLRDKEIEEMAMSESATS